MKGMKASELKAFIHVLTENDDVIITEEFISELFNAFGDEYEINSNCRVRTHDNTFKGLVLNKIK